MATLQQVYHESTIFMDDELADIADASYHRLTLLQGLQVTIEGPLNQTQTLDVGGQEVETQEIDIDKDTFYIKVVATGLLLLVSKDDDIFDYLPR